MSIPGLCITMMHTININAHTKKHIAKSKDIEDRNYARWREKKEKNLEAIKTTINYPTITIGTNYSVTTQRLRERFSKSNASRKGPTCKRRHRQIQPLQASWVFTLKTKFDQTPSNALTRQRHKNVANFHVWPTRVRLRVFTLKLETRCSSSTTQSKSSYIISSVCHDPSSSLHAQS